MDGKISHEQPSGAPASDELNFSGSPTVDLFIRSLRAGDIDTCLQMMGRPEVRVIDQAAMERYQAQLLQHAENSRAYEAALQEVKAERDALLEGVFHIYQTFSFVFRSIDQVKEQEEPTAKVKFLSKALQTLGLKNVSPAAVMVLQSLIDHLRHNMGQLTKNVEQLGERLNPSLAILVRHGIIQLPAKTIESANASETA